MEIWKCSVEELLSLLKNEKISSEDVFQAFSKRIERYDELIKSFIFVDDISTMTLENKKIPFAVKDNILVRGMQTTCASKMLWNYQSPFTATAVQHLQNVGMVVLGKTNLDEFSMGSTTENSSFAITKNPWDLNRIPGGSSGGSAAALSAGFVPFALGSDTGGSIRQPAAFCGVVGFKPSYGLVSRHGLIAFASSFDQIGTLTRSVRDSALITEIISGDCRMDATKRNLTRNYLETVENGLKGEKLLIITEMIESIQDNGIRKRFNEAVELFKWLGAEIHHLSLPEYNDLYGIYTVLSTAEASSNLSRYDGIKYGLKIKNEENIESLYFDTRDMGFGKEVKNRILIGTFNLSYGNYREYYLKALQFREALIQKTERLMRQYDAIISPTTLTLPGRIGERQDMEKKELYDKNTILANLTRIPAISVPMGLVGNLPCALQIMTARFSEDRLFRIARTFEKTAGIYEDGHYPFPHLEWLI